jgi:RimJ/RimL family protein N-acetyltransferase
LTRPRFTLRESTTADLPFVWFCRNDPLTRANSNRAHEISWLEIKSLRVLIFEHQGVPVGYGRIDRQKSLSWVIAPMFRRQGMASILIRALIYRAGHGCSAEIKAGNVFSQKAAAKAGLQFDHNDGALQIWKPA